MTAPWELKHGRYQWSQELVDLLLKLRNAGLSASQIAKRIGCGFSRNAVIGKLDRLKSPLMGNKGPSERKPKTHVFVQGIRKSRATAKVPRPVPLAPPVQMVAPVDGWSGTVAAIAGLQPGECRWPIGEPTAFCKAPVAPIGIAPYPYCLFHAHLAVCPSHREAFLKKHALPDEEAA